MSAGIVAASSGAPKFINAVVPNGGSLAPGIAVQGQVCGLQMSAAWTAAVITFQGSCDGGATYQDVYDAAGAEKSITVVAAHFVLLSLTDFIGMTHIKVRSGTGAAPVNQGAARTIQVALAG